MLGLLGFKEGSWQDNPISLIIAVFILLLGTWGLVSAIMSEKRIRRHRERIDTILARLEPGFEPPPPTGRTKWVWIGFHSGIIVLGVVLLAVIIGNKGSVEREAKRQQMVLTEVKLGERREVMDICCSDSIPGTICIHPDCWTA